MVNKIPTGTGPKRKTYHAVCLQQSFVRRFIRNSVVGKSAPFLEMDHLVRRIDRVVRGGNPPCRALGRVAFPRP